MGKTSEYLEVSRQGDNKPDHKDIAAQLEDYAYNFPESRGRILSSLEKHMKLGKYMHCHKGKAKIVADKIAALHMLEALCEE